MTFIVFYMALLQSTRNSASNSFTGPPKLLQDLL